MRSGIAPWAQPRHAEPPVCAFYQGNDTFVAVRAVFLKVCSEAPSNRITWRPYPKGSFQDRTQAHRPRSWRRAWVSVPRKSPWWFSWALECEPPDLVRPLTISALFPRMEWWCSAQPTGTRKSMSPPCYTSPYEDLGASSGRQGTICTTRFHMHASH